MKQSTYLRDLQLATNWRAQYNPLRGLSLRLVVAMLEQGERGNYARLQWLYRYIEKRNTTLRAVLSRRQSSLTRLDWDIRVRSDAANSTSPRSLGARQAAVLREAYERIENLREAVTFLDLAAFRGYAHLERHLDSRGRTVRLQPVPQWFWARLGPDAPWQYNAEARPGLPMPQDPVLDPMRFLYREVEAPVDEIALIAHVRQALSQKDWDAFVETYGLPPLFIELPPEVPAEREAEYQAMAEAIIGDARGTMPNGTRVQTVDTGARGQNPFAEHLRYQDEQIVLAATGGKLTALAEPGTGTLAGSAHQAAFDDITEGEAVVISEVFQRQFDAPLLTREFPGQPQLAYFELAATRDNDPASVVAQALTLAKAGYEIDPAELSERTGYTLKLRDYPLPLSNRAETVPELTAAQRAAATKLSMNLRTEILNELRLAAAAGDGEIVEALRAQAAEIESLRNRCARLNEAQADADLERFGDVITNREVVRAQLLANRDGTLAVLGALRVPVAMEPLHQPRFHRPNLALLNPLAPEPDTAAARRVANRARQLQSELKIGHHAAFRLAEGEEAEGQLA